MREQLYCPHCGNPLVSFCQHCGTSIPAATDQQTAGWPRHIEQWSLKQIVLLWMVGIAAVFYVLSLDKQYIGVALNAFPCSVRCSLRLSRGYQEVES